MMSKGMMSSQIAMCHNCNWEDAELGKAGKRARQHAIKTGHFTSVESNRVIQYDGQALKNKEKK